MDTNGREKTGREIGVPSRFQFEFIGVHSRFGGLVYADTPIPTLFLAVAMLPGEESAK
jgi:hypothetical protein